MDPTGIYQAVFFFDKGKIAKEMLYSEFEAVLDNVVGLPQFENRTMPVVFLKINGQLEAVAAVFFLIHFGAGGKADPAWNIPLQQLSEAAARGPDMGAGPIKLACQSQCPAAWHQQSLWDPDLSAKHNHLDAIRNALKRNRLALLPIEPAAPAVTLAGTLSAADVDAFRQQVRQEERARAEGVVKEAKLSLASQANQHRQEIDDLHRHYLRDMRDDHEQLRRLGEALKQAEARAQKLEQSLAEQTRAMTQLRQEFVADASQQAGADAQALQALEERFELELKARLQAETDGLREALELKSVELSYRDEQMAVLRDELTGLHQDKQRMLRDGAGNLLDKLEKSGISFVAWSPALGHINIPLAEMGQFLEAPDGYFARKADVPLPVYEAWLGHHSFPVCQAELEDGGLCGEPIERVASPVQFLSGRSDCCPRHQRPSGTRDAV